VSDDVKSSQSRESQQPEVDEPGEGFEIESINDENVKAKGKSQDASLAQELEKARNDYLYLRAEFDNYRKNAIKERSDLIKYGGERMARELLDVVDTFELALNTPVTPENIESFVKGMELTATNLKGLLQRFGIQEINPLGENFDPSLHEALGSEPTSDFAPGKVCRVYKKAYKLHDRLVRPAQVVIATEPAGEAGEAH
jgi:molecular chaperone GrpE